MFCFDFENPYRDKMLRHCSLKKKYIFDLGDLEIFKMATKMLKNFHFFSSATNWISVYG